MRVLTLTNPRMRGPDVTAVQKALQIRVDGIFGPGTARAVFAWKRTVGYPEDEINAGLGERGQGYIQMDVAPPEPIGNILYTTPSTRHKFDPIFWTRLTVKSPSADGVLHTGHLTPGSYSVEVTAADVMGNATSQAFPITIIPM